MSVRMHWRCALLSAAIVTSTASAHADDLNKVAAATLLFDEGVRALDAGRLDEACQKLAKSQELAPSGGTLLALAECHERAGRVASSWIAYRGAAARAAAAGKSDAEASALASAARLEPKLARLTIKVAPGLPANVALLRDTSVVSTSELGVAVPVDPGKHEIHAGAPGSKPWLKQIQVNAGASVTVEVPPLEVDAQAEPVSDDSPGRTQRILGITAAGIGVGAVIGGGIFGGLAISANNDADGRCQGQFCTQQGLDAIDTASSRALVSTILFITGAAFVAGGAALYFTAPKAANAAHLDWSTGTFRW